MRALDELKAELKGLTHIKNIQKKSQNEWAAEKTGREINRVEGLIRSLEEE